MSVKINNMSEATFTTTPNGITKNVIDNSTSASTTSFVKTFISTYLIPLADTVSIASTITFSTIYVNLLRGVSSLTLRGNLSIGGANTGVTLLGNTLNIDANYPYILSCPNQLGSKIQAGYMYVNGQGDKVIDTPINPTGSSIAFASPSTKINMGVVPPTGGGFIVRVGNNAETVRIGEANWIMFSE